jgi:hypothetical protein
MRDLPCGQVLAYSEGRVAQTQHLRRQRMVDRLGNLLEQLHEQQPYFGRAARPFFEAKHQHLDEEWYETPPHKKRRGNGVVGLRGRL